MHLKELGDTLADMYNNAGDKEKVANIHLFGIEYGEEMINNGITVGDVIKEAGLSTSYATEVQKGINIGRLMNQGEKIDEKELEDSNISYWFAGANYEGEDLTDQFIENDVLGIGWVHKDLEGIIQDNEKMLKMYANEQLEVNFFV